MKNKYFALLPLILVVLVAGCSKPHQNNVNNPQVNNKKIQNDVTDSQAISSTEEVNSDWATYSNNKLNIKFEYPKEFLGITEEENGKDHLALKILDNSIFLAADNGEKSVARGAYWGDEAEFIINKDYIINFCNNKSNCEVKKNKNNIYFAKVDKEITGYDGLTKSNIFYYFYNPNSEYYGIVISDSNIKKYNIVNLEDKLDYLVDGIVF